MQAHFNTGSLIMSYIQFHLTPSYIKHTKNQLQSITTHNSSWTLQEQYN